jgi:hypothetical protein
MRDDTDRIEEDVQRDLAAALSETPAQRWRRERGEAEAETIRAQQREREREARRVRKAALAEDVVAIMGATLAEGLAAHREHVRDVLIGIVAHLRGEIDALHEEVRALRIAQADARHEARQDAAGDLRFRRQDNARH